MNLSKSKILTYLNCPRQFKYKYIYELPEPTNVYAQRGSEVHDILNKFFDVDFKTIDSKSPKEEFTNIIKKINPESYKNHQLYYDHFVDFEVKCWDNDNKKAIMPKYREVKIRHNGLTGIIDRIDQLEGDQYIVVDYKTGKIPIKNELKALKKFNMELTKYAVLANQKLKLDVQQVGVLSLSDGRLLTKPITEQDIEELFDIVDYVKREIEEKHFDKGKKPNCFFCGYKKICVGGKTDGTSI